MDILKELQKNRLFASMTAEDCQKLVEVAKQEEAFAGKVIFNAGDAGDALYAIIAGVVSVLVTEKSGEETEVATLPAGSYFGEMEIIEAGMTRTATIQAKEKATLLRFDAAQLRTVLDKDDHLAKEFYRTVSKELIRRLRDTTTNMGFYKSRSLVL